MHDLAEYHRPRDLAEALRLLRRSDVRGVPLGGGTALVGAPPAGVEAVVDLRELGLDAITTEPPEPGATGGPFPLRLGATASLAAVAAHAAVQSLAAGLLVQAVLRSAAYTLRDQVTVGGTLAAGDARHPVLVALLALDAEVVAWVDAEDRDAREDARAEADKSEKPRVRLAGYEQRRVPLNGWLSYRDRILRGRAPGLIVELRIPQSQAPTGGAFEGVARTPADAPIVCAAARVYADRQAGRAYGVRLALGGVGARPVRVPAAESLLEGQVVTAEWLARVQAVVSEQVAPPGDWLGSAEYRREMAGVLARRAVEAAWERAR